MACQAANYTAYIAVALFTLPSDIGRIFYDRIQPARQAYVGVPYAHMHVSLR